MLQWMTGENTGRTGPEKELLHMHGLPMVPLKIQSFTKQPGYLTAQQYFSVSQYQLLSWLILYTDTSTG